MENKKDFFGYENQSQNYDLFRPQYPQELINSILSQSKNKNLAVDVGTGTGIIAYPLSFQYKKVIGVDISEKQLEIPIQKYKNIENLKFSLCESEKLETILDKNSVDAIIVAQAYHWFNKREFFESCEKVLNKDGIICLCGYNMFIVNDNALSSAVSDFYKIVKPYFKCNRETLENEYNDQEFLGYENKHYQFQLNRTVSINDILFYFDTFSAYRLYVEERRNIEKNDFIDPLEKFKGIVNSLGYGNKIIQITTPFFLKVLKLIK